ncbi:MAG: response regulator [Methylotenera sp.]|nr:response regulator [Oligoflexia bacterium]
MAKKLLVADDSLTIQKVIKLALSNDGYEIQTVSDGNDAVQQISLFRPDVILIDVSLPGKSAFEVKTATNRQGDFDNTRFILMSSAFEKVDEEQVQQVKFHGRLTKPFDPTHLRQVILDVLGPQMPPLPASFSPAQITSAPPPLPQQAPFSTESLWEDQDGPHLDYPDLSPPPLPGSSRSNSERTMPSIPHPGLPPLPELTDFLSSPGDSPMDSVNSSAHGSDDIKHLTESTVRMSGLDDFQWSINETAKKPGGLQFEPPSVEAPNFDLGPEIEAQDISYESQHQATPSMSSQINPTQLEEMIVRQVQKTLEETLEKMAQKILPEVAERVIKQEIKRLLQDQA